MDNKGRQLRKILIAIGDWFVDSITKGSTDYHTTVSYWEEIEHVTPRQPKDWKGRPDYRKSWW